MDFLTLQDKFLPMQTIGGNDNGEALRIVNLTNSRGYVKVAGGNSYIYNDNEEQTDINVVQYRRKGAGSWQTVPADQTVLSCAANAYIDFRYVNKKGEAHEINENRDLGFFRISAGMYSEISGQLNAMQINPSSGKDKFHSMFWQGNYYRHASALVLPTNIGECDYCSLFESCTSLYTPPQATNFTSTTSVSDLAFAFMFKNCSSLTAGMTLTPTAYLGTECCKEMYSWCNSLPKAANMNIRRVGGENSDDMGEQAQFRKMYMGCVSLADPDGFNLNLTKTSLNCCLYTFSGCTSLSAIPSLPATERLGRQCYMGMFEYCSTLNDENISLPASTVSDEAYRKMFKGCVAQQTMPSFYHVVEVQDQGFAEMFNGDNNLTASSVDFSNITTVTGVKDFQQMFKQCVSLDPSYIMLPTVALISGNSMFEEMFNGCTGLTLAPDLPYTKISEDCYRYMFANCWSLETAPALMIENLANMGKRCYEGMFSGCNALNSLSNMQSGWFRIDGYLVSQDYAAWVQHEGDFYCHENLLDDPNNLSYSFNSIPFSAMEGYRWRIHPREVDAPFTRYQDRSASLTSQWPGLSAYGTNADGSYDSGFGFYRNNSVNDVNLSGEEIFIIHFDNNITSVTYPWKDPEKYTVTSIPEPPVGWTHETTLPNGINYDNTNHRFTYNSSQGNGPGIYPESNTSGLYHPYRRNVTYTDSLKGITSTKAINFVFIVDEKENLELNVLLVGNDETDSVITIKNIPNNSRIMIRRYNKANNTGLTDWCDVTCYQRVKIPIPSGEWLGIKNGKYDLEILTQNNVNYVVDNGNDNNVTNVNININTNTKGTISGNIRAMGCPYFELTDVNEEGSGWKRINLWGKNVLKNFFKSSKFKTVSENLFANCNMWNMPSGCYGMFYGSNITDTPIITDSTDGQRWRDDGLFQTMFLNNSSLTHTIKNIENADDNLKYGTGACYQMFYNSNILGWENSFNWKVLDEDIPYAYKNSNGQLLLSTKTYSTNVATGSFYQMFCNCDQITLDHTYNFTFGSIGSNSWKEAFKNCTKMTNFNSYFYFNNVNTRPTTGAFEGMFYGCTALSSLNFGMDDGGAISASVSMFKEMCYDCTALLTVNNLILTGTTIGSCAHMFYNCNKLVNTYYDYDYTASGIFLSGATGTGCYQGMFDKCSSLVMIDRLTVNTTALRCCDGMFERCTSFTNANNKIKLTHTPAAYCYNHMFAQCSNLRTSPSIIEPSENSSLDTPVRSGSFSHMFCGCSNLTEINLTCLAGKWNSVEDLSRSSWPKMYDYMFKDCLSLNFGLYTYGNYYDDDLLNSLPVVGCGPMGGIAKSTLQGMFQGCTSMENTPVMLGITKTCYNGTLSGNYADMFSGCSSLKRIVLISYTEEVPSSAIPQGFNAGTFDGIPSNGTLYTNQDATVCDLTSANVPFLNGDDLNPLQGWTNEKITRWSIYNQQSS